MYTLPQLIQYHVMAFLHFQDLVNLLTALPLLKNTPGLRYLWKQRLDITQERFLPQNAQISWDWIFANIIIIRKADIYIYARRQGVLNLLHDKVQDYMESNASKGLFNRCKWRQTCIHNIDYFIYHRNEKSMIYLHQIDWEYF